MSANFTAFVASPKREHIRSSIITYFAHVPVRTIPPGTTSGAFTWNQVILHMPGFKVTVIISNLIHRLLLIIHQVDKPVGQKRCRTKPIRIILNGGSVIFQNRPRTRLPTDSPTDPQISSIICHLPAIVHLQCSHHENYSPPSLDSQCLAGF